MSTVTYSPEDNKLRLYVGRVPRDEYERLRAAGFTSTPKQDCDFVATWTPSREDLASEYLEDGEDIGDEDYSPEERSADRAERFSGYRDKRADEAGGHADTFEAGPSAFGHQNRQRAERQAMRHDRHRVRAVSQWSKAEYWQQRTAGVIRHALHKSSASVRRGRILTLEAELRKLIADYTPADNPPAIIEQQVYDYAEGVYKYDGAKVPHVWVGPKGRGGRWAELASLERLKAASARWEEHLRLRLTYENAMLAAEGGSAAEADMEPGGWIGKHQIHAVNKSPATGRVVSVKLMAPEPWYRGEGKAPLTLQSFNIERMGESVYRAPTDEEREQFARDKKASKRPPVSIINPTDIDAERLQAMLNARTQSAPRPVNRITQRSYSANSGGEGMYYICEYSAGGVSFKCRMRRRGFSDYRAAESVVILTDKPQKPIPSAYWEAKAEQEAELVTH